MSANPRLIYAAITENYSYDYDNDGLLTGRGDYTLTRDTQNGYVTQLSDGTLTQNKSYNSYGEITEVSDNIFTYQLTSRDNAGAITQKSETLNGTTTTYNYTYDDLGRLTEACRVGGTHQMCETYAYDNNGNRLSATVNGETTTASYTLDDQLEVYGDNSYRYDDDGNLVEKIAPDGTTTYEYGTMGQLLQVITPNHTISYKHNALNQRVAKLIDGQVVEKYLWGNLTTLLAVYDANDNLVQRFEYAGQRMPVSMTANGSKYYLHYDQVGSLRAVNDASGNIVKEVVYDTFGNIVSDSNPDFNVPFGFAGGLHDTDTKLTRFGYRDYDAYTGKWTAKDPIGFDGGDSNLYGYVLQDPVNFVDIHGLKGGPLSELIPTDTFLQDLGMNETASSIFAEGINASLIAGATSGPLALPAAIIAFPVGITEGLISESSGLNDWIDKIKNESGYNDFTDEVWDYLRDTYQDIVCD